MRNVRRGQRTFARVTFVVLLAFSISFSAGVSVAAATAPTRNVEHALPSKKAKKKGKKTKVVALATAAAWINVATQHKLTADQPTPQQFTDTSAPLLQTVAPLLTGLGFKGAAVQTFNRTQPDTSDASLLVGNYILRLVVFGSASDAQKFRAADAKSVTDRGQLKQVGTYRDGVILDDTQGHINAMFTIRNGAVDIRTGIAEHAPGDGVNDIKKIADYVVANSKS